MTTTKAKRELSPQAAAAQAIRQEMKRRGYQCRARSSSFSMGDSVTVDIETPDLHPDKRKELSAYCDQFQYGSFDGMTDSYDYTNRRSDLAGQSKYVHCNFVRSDECTASIWAYLQEIGNMTDHERENLRHQVWSGVWGDFWDTWPPESEPVDMVTTTKINERVIMVSITEPPIARKCDRITPTEINQQGDLF